MGDFPNDGVAGGDRGAERGRFAERLHVLFSREKFGCEDFALRDVEQVECVARNVDGEVTRRVREVDGDDERFVFKRAEEGVLTMRVERRILIVDIHQIEESTLGDSLFAVAEVENRDVFRAQSAFARSELRIVGLTVVVPAAQSRHAPIVENRRSAVVAAVTLGVGCLFAKFLTCVDHHRAGRNHRTDDERRDDI